MAVKVIALEANHIVIKQSGFKPVRTEFYMLELTPAKFNYLTLMDCYAIAQQAVNDQSSLYRLDVRETALAIADYIINL